MPTRVKGQTVENSDGSYSIFINARLSADQQQETYVHELEHIKRKDFERTCVQRIESYTHNIMMY